MPLHELVAHTSCRQCLDEPAQIIEVACQAVHAMHGYRVAGTNEAHQRFKLRASRIFAGGFVGEGLGDFDSFQLPFCVLVNGADPYIPDALSTYTYPSYYFPFKSIPLPPLCQKMNPVP